MQGTRISFQCDKLVYIYTDHGTGRYNKTESNTNTYWFWWAVPLAMQSILFDQRPFVSRCELYEAQAFVHDDAYSSCKLLTAVHRRPNRRQRFVRTRSIDRLLKLSVFTLVGILAPIYAAAS